MHLPLPLSALWRATAWPSLEYLTLHEHPSGWRADSQLVGRTEEGETFALRYQLTVDAQWRVRELHVWRGPAPTLVLHLRADGAGHWHDGAGTPRPDLTGCLDVDLPLSPFTNTLPVRRVPFAPGQPVTLAVAYVELPAARVRRVEQQYVQRSPTHYYYHQPDLQFEAEITVDADGLVTTYPGLFERVR